MGESCFDVPDRLLELEEALDFLLSRARPLTDTEEIDAAVALGRVLARGVTSNLNVPPWDNSAMDGYAVRASEISEARVFSLPISQRIPAGVLGQPLERGTAARIFTGAPMPDGADAVVIQERCDGDARSVRIPGPLHSGENVRPKGNDIEAGSEILNSGMRLRPQELGLAASVGVGRLRVYRRLRVAVFSTGDELVRPGRPLAPGQIYNSNRYTLLGLLQGLGCEILDLGIIEDVYEATRDALLRAAKQADLIVTSGGVSVGEEDHVKRAVETAGSLEMWKIRIKPGKPLAYGRLGDADFLGTPGNPVSALVTFMLFARPFILKRQGASQHTPREIPVAAAFSWTKAGNRRQFVRARLRAKGTGSLGAEIFSRQGSDVLTSAVWGDGLVVIPAGVTVSPGDTVSYIPFRELLG